MLNSLKSPALVRRMAGFVAGLVLTAVSVQSAHAGSFTYVTAPGAKDPSNEAISAKADVTVKDGEIDIVLYNLQQNPISAGQLVSGISFNVSGVNYGSSTSLSTTNSGSVTSSLNLTTGVYGAPSSDTLTRWKATGLGSNVSITTLSGGNPNRLIIGPDTKGNFNPSLGGLYTAANNSIQGDLPLVLGSATFKILISNLDDDATISNVVFRLGTDSGTDTFVGQTPNAVPEPGSLAVWGVLALVGFGYTRRRKVA